MREGESVGYNSLLVRRYPGLLSICVEVQSIFKDKQQTSIIIDTETKERSSTMFCKQFTLENKKDDRDDRDRWIQIYYICLFTGTGILGVHCQRVK